MQEFSQGERRILVHYSDGRQQPYTFDKETWDGLRSYFLEEASNLLAVFETNMADQYRSVYGKFGFEKTATGMQIREKYMDFGLLHGIRQSIVEIDKARSREK